MNIKDMPYSSYWYNTLGYFLIDLDLFGNNLCELFNTYLDGNYSFQKLNVSLEVNKDMWPIWMQKKEERTLALISKKTYQDNELNRITTKPYINYDNAPSLFTLDPLKVEENDFVLYFDKPIDNINISLGHIVNNNFNINNFKKINSHKEIEYINPNYQFINNFINSILEYKFIFDKPILNQSDLDIILSNFNINKDELRIKLLNILKVLEINMINTMSNITLEDTLKLKRIK